MLKICVLGTHGSAKTSLVYKLAAFYKMKELNTIVIHETARTSPFPINKAAIPKTTLHLMSTQLTKELEADAQGFELAIIDRSLRDAPVYINYLGRGNKYTKKMEEFSTMWAETYDVMVYLEPDENRSVGGDGIRSEDKDYQLEIRNAFRDMIADLRNVYKENINIVESGSWRVFDNEECSRLINEIDNIIESKKETTLV